MTEDNDVAINILSRLPDEDKDMAWRQDGKIVEDDGVEKASDLSDISDFELPI